MTTRVLIVLTIAAKKATLESIMSLHHYPLLTRFQWHTSDSVNISLLFCVFKVRMFLLHCLCLVIFRVSSVIGEGKVIQSFKLGQTDEWE